MGKVGINLGGWYGIFVGNKGSLSVYIINGYNDDDDDDDCNNDNDDNNNTNNNVWQRCRLHEGCGKNTPLLAGQKYHFPGTIFQQLQFNTSSLHKNGEHYCYQKCFRN